MKKYLYITIAAGLAFVLTGVLAYQSRRIVQLDGQVGAVQQGLLHQSAEEMDGLSLSMEKALMTTDAAHAAALMHTIGQSAALVQQKLALLPISTEVQPALALANRLSDEASGWLAQLAQQEELTAAQRIALENYLALCSQLAGQLVLADSAADLARLQLDLPSLASVTQAKCLPQGDITQEEALSIARQFVGDHRVIAVETAPGTTGALAAYGVTVKTADLQLNLEITRQGGKVLWMMPETASFAVTQSQETCQQEALDFLAANGFPGMQPVHRQVYDGLCVISLVPMQGEVLLYPDLIRVQVRMDTAQVVGVEMHNYWLNHTLRELPAPQLTPSEARARIDGHAQVISIRLCLIPADSRETLCYELTVTYQGETYLVYIDTLSGREAELLKTIYVENGSLTA